MSFLFGVLAHLLGEEVSDQKSKECNCYFLADSGPYRASQMLTPCSK
jgi:hypothetical protein